MSGAVIGGVSGTMSAAVYGQNLWKGMRNGAAWGSATAAMVHLVRSAPKVEQAVREETQPKGNNEDGFESQRDAAIAALKRANPVSIEKNLEYGGYIYEKNGRFFYTEAITQGKIDSFNIQVAREMLPLPQGASEVGVYHTHGDYSTVEGIRVSKALDQNNSDQFSIQDLGVIQYHGLFYTGDLRYRGYLGTPSGRFYEFNPAGTTARQIEDHIKRIR